MPRLETPTFARAAVAAPHSAAAQAGRDVLAQGGNAIEAMIAMAATIAVVYPHMNAIGGDGFWLIRAAGGRMAAIDASGHAGSRATPTFYEERGFDAIPSRGPLAALTVAGTVDGWRRAREIATALGGRLPLDVILGDAIARAREGVPVSPSEGRYWARTDLPAAHADLEAAPGFRETYFVEGERPSGGATRRFPRLADTLAQLAAAGLRDFYRGDVSREIAADLERLGAPIARTDLERYEARLVEPLRVRLDGLTAYNLPPPSQGLAALAILGIAERLDLGAVDGVDWHHGLVEAVKRAFRLRDRIVVDPSLVPVDPASVLTDAALAREAAAISMRRAAPHPGGSEADTVWMGAIDGDGLAVSFIQSVYWEYGSGCVLPATGIAWQNRGTAFSLRPDAANPLAPGRKPFHTLNPALAVLDDGRVVSYGCMGGDGQPQTQAQVLTRWRAGATPAEAVDAPRWLLGRTWGDQSTSLKLESRFDESVVARLSALGHPIEVLDAAYSDTLGHAGMLVRDARDGRVEACHDPRSDGGSEGL